MPKSTEEKTIPFEEALAIIDRELSGRTVETETLPVAEARGRTLAEAPVSRLDLPPFDKSAMDGYAVMEGDEREQYRVLESIPAGRTPTRPLEPGAASRVMTGAPVPEGTGKVIMFERTDMGRQVVRVHRHGGKSNICRQGEDVKAGERLLEPGTKLDAVAVANLIGCGVTEVLVRRPIRVAVISTGDELVDAPEKIGPGKIMDSNGPMLAGLAAEHDLEVAGRGHAPDTEEETTAAVINASARADVTVLSGGVSAGDFDCVGKALHEAGFTIHFNRVAVQPGKPLTFATRERRVAVGLPGNPVSVFCGFHLVVLRAVAHLRGAKPADVSFRIPLGEEFTRRRGGRASFVPARIRPDGRAVTVPYHGSAHLTALSAADGLVHIPKGVVHVGAGEQVLFLPLLRR